MSTLAEIKDYSPNTLAQMADCASPDNFHSAGAEFLKDVRDAFVDAAEDLRFATEEPVDVISELADACVPIYTYKLWSVFCDLALWQADLEDIGPITDMEKGAAWAVYVTAEALISALNADLVEDEED